MNTRSTTRVPKNILKTCLSITWLACAALLLSGCPATAPVKEVKEEPQAAGVFVWPAPPEQARVRYVGSLSETSEVEEKKTSFKDVLVGEETADQAKTLIKPKDVHVDATGRVFVSDSPPDVLIVFDEANDKVEFWGQDGFGNLNQPMGITSDSSGNIYVADAGDARVVIFDTNGQYKNAIGGKEHLKNPVGVAVDEVNERIYVSDSWLHKILIFSFEGDLVSEIGERGSEEGQFNYPTFLEISRDGKLYVADSMNFRIQVFSMDGKFERSYGKVGKNVGDFNRLKGITINDEGHLFAIDGSFNNFQIFNDQFELLLWVGEGKGSIPGYFNLPVGIDIDHRNRIYVADSINRRIQIFEYLQVPNSEQADTED